MLFRHLSALAIVLFAASCGERGEVVVTETREITTRDVKPRLFATSNERFRNARPSPVKGNPPADWLAIPATEFRLLNYRFGIGGQVWVSVARGGVLDNVNRWLGQFGADSLEDSELSEMTMVPMAGAEAFWVEAAGTYSPGMGQQPQSDQAIAGAILPSDDGVLTLKMVGPKAEVEQQIQALKDYAASLEWQNR